MNLTVSNAPTAPLLLRSEMPDKTAGMAKAGIRKSEKELTWEDLAWCLEYARYQSGLTLDEFSNRLKKDSRQVRRMLDAAERPQIEALWPDQQLRRHVIIGMAIRGGDMDVTTTISVRRIA